MKQNADRNSNLNVGKNLTTLLQQTGLTISGFSHATNISLNHARIIKNGRASITIRTANKIADFFQIEVGYLFLPTPIKLKSPTEIPNIAKFYKENIENKAFFTATAHDKQVMFILTHHLILGGVLDDWTRSKEIIDYVNNKKELAAYRNLFNIRNVSKALSRIFNSTTILERRDMRGNGKVFQYRKANLNR